MSAIDLSVFEQKDYRDFLKAKLAAMPARGRGHRSRLAEALQCDSAHISRVLRGQAHLSLEQAEKTAQYFSISAKESEAFLLLVLANRAGTASLRRHFEQQLQRLQQEQLVLKNRIQFEHALSKEDQTRYYSSWKYVAAHVLISIPEFQSAAALRARLGMTAKEMREVLDYLVSLGLARREGDRVLVGSTRVHLEKDSPHVSRHHINWRLQAIQALDRSGASEDDLHYSSVVSMSRASEPRVREILFQAIEKIRAVVRDARDEEMYCYAIDLFRA